VVLELTEGAAEVTLHVQRALVEEPTMGMSIRLAIAIYYQDKKKLVIL
jgi:hypothetical protein